MKFNYLALPLAALICGNAFAADPALNTDEKKISYAIGVQVGSSIKKDGIDLDADALSLAIKDVLQGNKLRLSQEEGQQAMNLLNEKMRSKHAAVATENKTKGEAFLKANAKKAGVKSLASGIQYKVNKSGSGKSPTKANSVVFHYRGTLIDGTEFDSSFKRGEPLTSPVTGVIQGWQEILPKMKEGDNWQVYIPSDLAYGPRGQGQIIGPNATLIFDIELIEVK